MLDDEILDLNINKEEEIAVPAASKFWVALLSGLVLGALQLAAAFLFFDKIFRNFLLAIITFLLTYTILFWFPVRVFYNRLKVRAFIGLFGWGMLINLIVVIAMQFFRLVYFILRSEDTFIDRSRYIEQLTSFSTYISVFTFLNFALFCFLSLLTILVFLKFRRGKERPIPET